MQTYTIVGAFVAALTFLQGTPAPVAPLVAPLIAAATSPMGVGIISGVVSSAAGAGISKAIGRRHAAFAHAQKMAREVAADMEKRDGPPPAPAGVNQFNWDECFYAAKESHMTVTGPVGDNNIRVEGIPPACMNLAAFISGGQGDMGRPIPCGSACIEYTNMTPEYYENVRAIINTQMLHHW